MANDTMVTLSRGGSKKTTKPIKDIDVPNLWHVAATIRARGTIANPGACADLILECWNRAHDFKRHIEES